MAKMAEYRGRNDGVVVENRFGDEKDVTGEVAVVV
jgi:hypothetical protein